jgi:lipoprotein-releasing system permease protein
MTQRVEFWIAGRYLRSRRASRFVSLITFIATAGVALGVCALIVVTGVMSGLQKDLREKILIANAHVRVLTYGEGLRIDDWQRILGIVRRQEGVVAAAPFILSQGLVSTSHDYAEGAYVLGISPDTGTRAVTGIARSFTTGDLRFLTNQADVDGGVALGKRMADRLSAYPGTVLTVISPAGSSMNLSVGRIVPRYWKFEVTGVFETGMYEYDNGWMVMSLALAQKFAALDSAVSGVEVRVEDPWHADLVANALVDTLGFPYRALDWKQQNASLFSALKLEKMAMGVILLLIVVVAAFNIVSTLTMAVSDRTKEIGILQAMGMTEPQVRRIFVTQGLVVGIIGTSIGLGLGLLLGVLLDKYRLIPLDASVYFIDHLPVDLRIADVAIITGASLLIATLATIYPAGQAARLAPVDAIRHE